MGSPEMNSRPEQQEMKPTEILKYMAQMGRDLERYAIQAQVMIEEAKQRGILLDLSRNPALKKFAVFGEYEGMLIMLRSELMSVTSDIHTQGLNMTKEEFDARLKKMGQMGQLE